jgi:hypothetical protein
MLFALLIAHPTMAPRKHLPKTAEEQQGMMAAIWSLTSSRRTVQEGQRKEATQQTTSFKLSQQSATTRRSVGQFQITRRMPLQRRWWRLQSQLEELPLQLLMPQRKRRKRPEQIGARAKQNSNLRKRTMGYVGGIGELGFWTSQSWW